MARKKPYRAVLGVYMDGTGNIVLIPNYRRELADKMSIEMGEMLYQLRAALDTCIYEAAILESGQNPPPDQNKLEFPICASRSEYARQAARKLGPLRQECRAIIEEVQPYQAPKLPPHLRVFNFNRTLDILNDWARKDRHRRLHVVGSWVSDTKIAQVICPKGVTVAEMNVASAGLLEKKEEIATFRLVGYTPGMKILANPRMTIDLALDESPPPCADSDILANRIRAMLMAVRYIVKSIQTSF